MLRKLISLFWDLCLLRKSPAEVPHSPLLLILLVSLNTLFAWYQFAQHAPDIIIALWQALVVVGLLALYTSFILGVKKRLARFIQTFTALIAVNTILDLLKLPLILIQPFMLGLTPPNTTLIIFSLSALFIMVFLNVWLIIIMSAIYAKSLDLKFMGGLLVTIGLMALDILVFSQVFTNYL